MSSQVVLILPNQLFKQHPSISKEADIFLIEEKRYFSSFKFHKQKLIFHRASMQAYKNYLEKKGYTVHYFAWNKPWKNALKEYKTIKMVRPFDNTLEQELPKNILFDASPSFLGGTLKKSKRYLMARFYQQQRKKLNILMTKDGPIGGKWSFDKDNRKPLKNGLIPPNTQVPRKNAYVTEAIDYVNTHFASNPGSTDTFIYPITFDDAEKWLDNFIKERLPKFGDYQDAMTKDYPFVYHSLLSPLLNSGLLCPDEVLNKALASKAPINSIEGFVRQIIGWREFILQIYLLEGERQRSINFFNHDKKIPSSFYKGKTGVLPVDHVLQKVNQYAYAHHIERLMILGNYMLLNEYNPDDVYTWFMEMFIDAYDWVMVPNIYGMSQYADGGLMSTKPYISSSNYILTMSDYPKGEWCKLWDNLFWSFLEKNQQQLAKNPRIMLLLKNLSRRKKE